MPLRNVEKRIATRFLAQQSGDQAKACQAILSAIRDLSLESLDRYLLFNAARWALEHWLVNSAAGEFERELNEAMREMREREEVEPRKKPPEWETAADLREFGPLHSKRRRRSDNSDKPDKKAS